MTQNDFFRDVTLPALGLTVTIRKVDTKAIGERAALDVLGSGEQADLPDDVITQFQKLSGQAALTPELLRQVLAMGERSNRYLVQESVVSLPDLLTAYRATGDERDFGMGPDFAALLAAIREHNGIEEVAAQTTLQGLAGLLKAGQQEAKVSKLPRSKARRK